jgi:hypothetical protein
MTTPDLFKVVFFSEISVIFVLSLVIYIVFLRRKKEDPDMSTRHSTFAAFTPTHAVKPFVRNSPRIYFILNRKTGKQVRSVGLDYEAALGRLGWDEADCAATDLGGTTKEPAMVEYQTRALDPDNPYGGANDERKD